MSGWIELELTGGAPDEPATLEELGAPGPGAFLDRLFDEVAGVGTVAFERQETEEDGTFLVEERCGTAGVGYLVTARSSLESSMFPTACRCETYGLGGIELVWEYGLDQVNVAGRIGFRHRRLLVRFRTEEERGLFERLWREVFAREPVFARVGAR